MKYYRVTHFAGAFYCRAESEESKNVERIMLDGSWSRLPPVYSVVYWRSLGCTVEEVAEGEANG